MSINQPGAVFVEGGGREALPECIRHVVCPSTLLQHHHTMLDEIPAEVSLHINVSSKLPIDRVLGYLNTGRYILPHSCGCNLFQTKFSQH